MFDSVQIVGAGRVGSALGAKLAERGVRVGADDPDLVLLCVPDRAIGEVARSIAPGPWVAHVSGATPLAALDPHQRRFGLHPLQTFTRSRGAEQLDGAFAAVTAETDGARAAGVALAELLGLRPFTLADDRRVLYHAGAAVASNYLVTLRRAAGRLLEDAGAPPEALDPLMRRTIENGFELTGPIARGDWETVHSHETAIAAAEPALLPAYRELARATALLAPRGRPEASMEVTRTVEATREALRRRGGTVALVPTMGALHDGHLSLLRAARAECDTVVMSLFVNPAQFAAGEDLDRYPHDERHDLALAKEHGVDIVFAPAADELYPPGHQTWVDVEQLGATLEGEHRPGHFRGVATVCLKLFQIVHPDCAYFGQKDAQQVAVLRRMLRDLFVDVELRVLPTVRDADGLALSSRNAYLSPEERTRALALPRALATRDPQRARALLSADGLEVDYVAVAHFDPPVLAAAVRVGGTRLIDNVVLDEEEPA
jgi:pantoate--beta-alanine ligase